MTDDNVLNLLEFHAYKIDLTQTSTLTLATTLPLIYWIQQSHWVSTWVSGDCSRSERCIPIKLLSPINYWDC